MNYNTLKKYNFLPINGGGRYNSSALEMFLKINDSCETTDNIFTSVFTALNEILEIVEIAKNYISLTKNDSFSAFDELKYSVYIAKGDSFNFSEKFSSSAKIQSFEPCIVTDSEPKSSTTEILIGISDGLNNAYDWIIPLNMIIDWANSSIQVMPQSESSFIKQPGVDGEIVEDTLYQNRQFNFTCYSELGLTKNEKEELKAKIVELLDSTKTNFKKMTFQQPGIAFDVKYSGAVNIQEGPSFVKATIPFISKPYGYSLFEKEVIGSGLIVNAGIKDTGCIHKISSGAKNPSFQLGSISYSWNGTVPENYTLEIDHNNLTCYLINQNGERENAMNKLSGEFQLIPAKSSAVLVADTNTNQYITTTLKEKFLWGVE